MSGSLLFGWLVVSGALARRSGAQRRSFAGTRVALRAASSLAAIGVHTLFYNAFFEDPMSWGVLGLAAVASRVRASGPQ